MPKSITKNNYKPQVLESQKPSIVEVFSKTCGTCQQMKPIFEELEQEYGDKYNFYIIDVEESRDFVQELGVSSIPTFLFFKNGQMQASEHGYIAKEDFAEKIESLFS